MQHVGIRRVSAFTAMASHSLSWAGKTDVAGTPSRGLPCYRSILNFSLMHRVGLNNVLVMELPSWTLVEASSIFFNEKKIDDSTGLITLTKMHLELTVLVNVLSFDLQHVLACLPFPSFRRNQVPISATGDNWGISSWNWTTNFCLERLVD